MIRDQVWIGLLLFYLANSFWFGRYRMNNKLLQTYFSNQQISSTTSKIDTDFIKIDPNPTEGSVLTAEEFDSASSEGDSSLVVAKTVPQPTINGGYAHTPESRAKISKANKGKQPWNAGKNQSEETRRKIKEAAQLLAQKAAEERAQSLNLTMDEYQLFRKEEKKKINFEGRQRRRAQELALKNPLNLTRSELFSIRNKKLWADPGYRANRTEESRKAARAKKSASNESSSDGEARAILRHTNETKRRISETVKRHWQAENGTYRNTARSTPSPELKERLSQALKKKWQDESYRQQMLISFATKNQEWKQKVAEKVKSMWQDEVYRERVLSGIRRERAERSSNRPATLRKPRPPRARYPRKPSNSSSSSRARKGRSGGSSSGSQGKKTMTNADRDRQLARSSSSSSDNFSEFDEFDEEEDYDDIDDDDMDDEDYDDGDDDGEEEEGEYSNNSDEPDEGGEGEGKEVPKKKKKNKKGKKKGGLYRRYDDNNNNNEDGSNPEDESGSRRIRFKSKYSEEEWLQEKISRSSNPDQLITDEELDVLLEGESILHELEGLPDL